ncbi:MAG: DUF5060 domain-containing protein [Bryobacteraceae bacterium]
MFRLRWLLISGVLPAALAAAAGDAPAFAPRVEQWGVQELTLRSQRTYDNPFADVSVQGRFQSQGRDITVEGFYDGNRTWKIRFMPQATGTWTFTTISSDPELGGKSGSFTVVPPRPGNHGPVRVHNQYHFSYADGTPYFLLGTTLYNWLNRDRDLEVRTLGTLSRHAFNKVRFLVFPKWMVFNRVEPPRFPYVQTGPGKFDLERFDPEFFAHYESRIRDLAALGIEADIILFHPYDKWGFAAMDQRHDEAYLRYVVARFSAFRNIWWTLANEFDLFRPGKDWRHLGELVARLDPYGHLRGIHNCCVSFYDNREPWITHVILQDITVQRLTPSPRNYSSMALDARKIGKPVLVDEYGYEGNNGQAWGNLGPREAVELHWAVTMAGAYGSHGETYVNPGHLLWWAVGGELVGEAPARLGFLKQIMSEAPYQEMEPAPDLIGNGDALVTALAKRGSYYLFHFGQVKETADWNIGFFGPATPSQPLPWKPAGPDTFKPRPVPEFRIGEGTFRVDMIDTWNMKVYPLGYTTGPVQRFQPQIAPGLMRFVRIDRSEPGKPAGSVTELFNQFGAQRQ